MQMKPVIYIVDNDKEIIESLTWILETIGLAAKAFHSAADFFEKYDINQHGCIILDIRMLEMNGIEAQEKLNAMRSITPIIFISGYSDVSLAVRIMKLGAFDFLTKPFNDQLLIDSINTALRLDKMNREKKIYNKNAIDCYSSLSVREKQILFAVTEGKHNKDISNELHISVKTVEAHRSSMMKKMRVRSVSELMKLYLVLEKE